jgi:hypothetical protein
VNTEQALNELAGMLATGAIAVTVIGLAVLAYAGGRIVLRRHRERRELLRRFAENKCWIEDMRTRYIRRLQAELEMWRAEHRARTEATLTAHRMRSEASGKGWQTRRGKGGGA